MKKIFTIAIIVSFLGIAGLYTPAFAQVQPVSDQSGFQILPCDGVQVPCDYDAAVRGFNNIVQFIIAMAIPIGVVMFGYAGFLYMRAGDNPGNKEKAKNLFKNVLIGFALVLGAWLIVYTVMSKLLEGSALLQTKTVDEVTQLKNAPNP